MTEPVEHDERTFIEWHRDFTGALENQAKQLISHSKAQGVDRTKSADLMRRVKILGACVATARKG